MITKTPENVKESPWPLNILEAIGIDYQEDDPLDHMDDLSNLELAMCMSRLTDREKAVIRMRFREQMTLREAGAGIGTSPERTRQIEQKALRKLRYPYGASCYILKHGAKAYVEMRIREEVEKQVAEQTAAVKAAYQDKLEKLSIESLPEIEDCTTRLLTKIEDLDLGVRPYNCLRRSGVTNVKELIERFPTLDDAWKIRNLGRKSLDEISQAVGRLGLRWPKGCGDV